MSLTPTQTMAELASETTSAAAASLKAKITAEAWAMLYRDFYMYRYHWIGYACLVGVCFLFAFPRFVVRVLVSVPPRYKRSSKPSAGGGGLNTGWFFSKASTKSLDERRSPHYSSASSTNEKAISSQLEFRPPRYLPPILSYLPFASIWLFAHPFRRLPGAFRSFMTMYHLYLGILYLLLVLFTLCWKTSMALKSSTTGLVADYRRPGYVAMAQFPLCVALGLRGNVIGLCVGKGYEKLKLYHKVTGRLMFASATWHVVAYTVKWALSNKFYKNSAKQYAIFGWLAYGSFLLITLTSIPWARNAFYGIFKICHYIGFVGMLIGIGYHTPLSCALPICASTAVAYGVSLFCGISKTRFATAELVAHPEAECVTITLPGLTSGWRAGQHVRLRILSLGLVHGWESHPFSIASAADTGNGALLLCKDAGDWTRHLLKFAAKTNSDEEHHTKFRKTTVIVEGPYGGLGNTLPSAFSSVLTIAGGSGITHSLSLAHELISTAPTGVVRARTVDLLWMVRTPSAAKPLLPMLQQLVSDAREWEVKCLRGLDDGQDVQPTALRIHLHITQTSNSDDIHLLSLKATPALDNEKIITDDERSGSHEQYPSGATTPDGCLDSPQASADNTEKFPYMTTHPASRSLIPSGPLSGIIVHPGRPDVSVFIGGIVDETLARHQASGTTPGGICVTTCGPDGLVSDVLGSASAIDQKKKDAVGGMEVEQESFGF